VIALLSWILWTAGMTAVFCVVLIWRYPRLMGRAYLRGFRRQAGFEGWNRLFYGGLVNAGYDSVVMTSPDAVTLFGAFDVTDAPVRIRGPIPRWGTYWSIALYKPDTVNFYVINDQQASGPAIDLVIAGPGSQYEKKEGEEVARAPEAKGFVILRCVVFNREDAADRDRVEELTMSTSIISRAGEYFPFRKEGMQPARSQTFNVPGAT
jgi:uncharacterized membrane protein